MDMTVVGGFLIAIILLLFLILKLKFNAFLALLISSIVGGLIGGLSPAELLETIQKGMGGTLGFVAVVVGLGAIFGALLEHAGGAQVLSKFLLKSFGQKNAPAAMVVAGFVIAIPVFFDVAFIILIPIVYALQKTTGKSLLLFALPLLAGLAITHAFVPPTPGPVAVAEILNADLGFVIVAGFCAGIPSAIIALLYSKYISSKIMVGLPEYIENENTSVENPATVSTTILLILLPIILIVIASFINSPLLGEGMEGIQAVFLFLGHPFTALIIANLLAWYFLGIKRGTSKDDLQKMSERSLLPAGIIILLTGAGGVLKQVLIDTGAGEMLARSMQDFNIPILLFAFICSGLVRILQGSATVAMITAAGLTAPLIDNTMSGWDAALIVIAISSGATILSHVNDSGFWLVNKFLGLSTEETLKSWTVLSTLIGITGFISVIILSLF